jgi:(5-formylfuran-3-yl)methyl phosphate synthase
MTQLPPAFIPHIPPLLLVSVRSAAEAEVALAGGASLIDVKEPARGSLGRPDDETVAAVLRCVAGRKPVSAALGELMDRPPLFQLPGLSFAKWGLAGCVRNPHWRRELEAARGLLEAKGEGCRAVVAAYADWRRAEAPPPLDVCLHVCEQRWAVLLLDTWKKDGSTLLDWIGTAELGQFRTMCWASGVRIALAGSLGRRQLKALRNTAPDWFAVRGAACVRGQRQGELDPAALKRLVGVLAESGRGPVIPESTPTKLE